MSMQMHHPEWEGDTEQTELSSLLLQEMSPIIPPLQLNQTLRSNLMQRVSNSIAAHAGLVTVRFGQGVWQTLKVGIRFKPLWKGKQGNSVLIEFAPGASLPAHRHNWLEEGIVLEGRLQMDDLDLGPMDYHISPTGSHHGAIRSQQGAIAYLRGTSLGDKAAVWKELLGGALPMAKNLSGTVFADSDTVWKTIAPGVKMKQLSADGEWVSRFYQMEPHACVPAHIHHLPEECMMLQGEVFLGDILLRKGDFQIAPAGSGHGEVYTDVGATLFVRSALDY